MWNMYLNYKYNKLCTYREKKAEYAKYTKKKNWCLNYYDETNFYNI